MDAFENPTLVYRDGVHLLGTMVWFDPSRRREFCAITNAGESRIYRHERVLWSSQTAQMEEIRRGASVPGLACPFHHRFNLGPLEFELLPSGYMAGGSQFLITFPGGHRMLYSGPFSVQPSLTAEPIEYTQCDLLVLDATHGHQHHTLPKRDEVYADIQNWTRQTLDNEETPVFLVANPGEAQDLIRVLAAHEGSLRVHRSIQSLNRAYRETGIPLPACKHFRGAPDPGDVVLWPAHLTDSPLLRHIKRPVYARLNGTPNAQDSHQDGTNLKAFPWSARADFQDVLHYTEQVAPQSVLTVGYHAQDLAGTLNQKGIQASPLLPSPQMALNFQ